MNKMNRMKATRLMIISLLAMIMMVDCKGKTDKVEQTAESSVTDSLQKNPSPGELPDSLQKYLMPEELSDTAIAHIRQSIATADTLMGQTSFYKEEICSRMGLPGHSGSLFYELSQP